MNAPVGYKSSKFENCNGNVIAKLEVYDQEQYYLLLWLRGYFSDCYFTSALKYEDMQFEHKY